MDREIVILVPDEARAYEVVKALKGLDEEGSIELYSFTVVERTAAGGLTVKRSQDDRRSPWGAALGMSAGALIGLLAGPVGAAVGAGVGGAAALGSELAYSGFAGDFVQGVAGAMLPGTCAVFASVQEDWTVPVDSAMAPLASAVLRQSTDDVVLAQLRAEWRAQEEELAQLDAEISQTSADRKAKLEAKRQELRAKQAAHRERLQKRAAALRETWDAKIASIKDKATSAQAEAKARHQEHADKLSQFAAAQKAAFHQLFA